VRNRVVGNNADGQKGTNGKLGVGYVMMSGMNQFFLLVPLFYLLGGPRSRTPTPPRQLCCYVLLLLGPIIEYLLELWS
jgi:hypothetical protein